VSASSLLTQSENLAGEVSPHITVMLEEAVEGLAIKSAGVYVDGTFGRGGHSRKILEKLGSEGRLIALDRDLAAVGSAASIQDARFQIVHRHFAALEEVLAELGVSAVDGVLLDLGISSPQIDIGERGFSFRFDGPLDMRMDQSSGQTAAEFVAVATEKKLAEVIKEYGEERFAKQIARAIVAARTGGVAITTTKQLAKVVASAVPKVEPGQDPATRTFQAIRIFLNQELEELSLVLPQCLRMLAPQGRLSVISFHSLEDRIVKQFVKSEQDRDDLPTNFPVMAKDLPKPRMMAIGKAQKPSEQEVKRNPRSRSAVLRVAERTNVSL
jgi:16S rRNA (cytosine1402-N4)-methyltransferase